MFNVLGPAGPYPEDDGPAGLNDDIVEDITPSPEEWRLVEVDSLIERSSQRGIVKYLLINHSFSTVGVFVLAFVKPETLPLMVTYFAIGSGALVRAMHLYFKNK